MTCESVVLLAVGLNAASAVWNLWTGALQEMRALQLKQIAQEATEKYFPGASVLSHLESDKKEQQ